MQRFILVVLLILSGLTVYSEEIIEPEEEHEILSNVVD